MTGSETTLVLLALPDGCGAFTLVEVAAARERARSMGFGAVPAEATSDTPEKLLTSAGMAELLGIGDTTVEQMAKDRRIPSVRIGKALRFEARAVLGALRRAER